MSEITELLDKLAAGQMTLAAVAANFSARTWVTKKRLPSSSYIEAARREQEDPEPIPEGAWGEVEAAYANGQISAGQYRVLFIARTGITEKGPQPSPRP